jgi:hypothetical protein
MYRAGGAFVVSGPGKTRECDTFTCCHCNRIVRVPVKVRPEDLGGFCTMCSKPVCPQCHAKGSCTPFEKWLDKVEARRSYGV